MNKKMKISLILGGMCVALSCGIAIQVRTISRIGTTTSRNSTENELRDAILRTKENYDNLYANEEKAEKLLEDERKSATENNSELAEIQENIKTLSTQLGLTDVTGKGVIIKVDDAMVQSTFDPNSTIVHDADLISIVNELKNAGAEAISINGSRIINTSEIAEINNSYIIVNGAKRIASPYEVKAIGDQTYLTSILSLKDSGFIDKYTSGGLIVRLEQKREVQIPKYDGEMKFNYAYEKEEKE